MIYIPQKITDEIERILEKGNSAEVVKLKHEIAVFERSSKKNITAPLEFKE